MTDAARFPGTSIAEKIIVSDRLRIVFYNKEVMPAGDIHDRFHIGGMAV